MDTALFRSQVMREILVATTAPSTKVNLYGKRVLISRFILSDYLGLFGVSGGFFLLQYFSDLESTEGSS